MTQHEAFMARALQLAACGSGRVSPNPMVGAVIVHNGRIIGEGYHRRFGEAHAEVNAVRSVTTSDERFLRQCTMYVTLEPCSHYGKTPPCADMIVSLGIPRVVVGCTDPFEKVSGRGIERMRAAGVDVIVGVLREECEKLNEVFMTAHRRKYPWITLKWAQSSDGFISKLGRDGNPEPVRFSTGTSTAVVHALRTRHDAIMVGSGTVMADSPRLDARFFCGDAPRRVIVDRRGRCLDYARSLTDRDIYVTATDIDLSSATLIRVAENADVGVILKELYKAGVTSVIVEGGALLLTSFIKAGLWDLARVEISPKVIGTVGYGKVLMPDVLPDNEITIDCNRVITFYNR